MSVCRRIDKRRYPTRQSATWARKRSPARKALAVYFCGLCRAWHLGHKKWA
jgi:hypothetical protein